ncbi:hypothetical protein BJ166DRAFT_509050, partial [Pestalotiopsis sp. NC0098]
MVWVRLKPSWGVTRCAHYLFAMATRFYHGLYPARNVWRRRCKLVIILFVCSSHGFEYASSAPSSARSKLYCFHMI